MNRTRALDEERKAILYRLQSSRDEYRKLLADEAPPRKVRARAAHGDVIDVPGNGGNRILAAPPPPSHPALQWMKDHPLLCAAIAAGVIAIGPRRILRSGMKGAVAVAALTRRNAPNVDVTNRLISLVATWLQRRLR